MSYRPITDMWILARAKLKGGEKYYGAQVRGAKFVACVGVFCGFNNRIRAYSVFEKEPLTTPAARESA